MNRITILKIASVVFAILLVGGFVSYRAGAFDKYISPTPEPQPQQPAPDATEEPSVPPDGPTEDLNPLLLSTSKSAGVLIPPKKSPPKSEPKQQIMPGSKSLAPLIPPKSTAPDLK